MSKKILGETFDIHGGGSDLKFPHHENEIAQSEAVNHAIVANYWMHTGMVQVNQEKMSKSLGNFFVINDVLKEYPAEVVRYFLISGHYRSEINYSDENLQSAKAALTRLYTALRGVSLETSKSNARLEDYRKRFNDAMNDDFNTPEALAVLFDLAKAINKNKEEANQYAGLLVELGGVLGILQNNPEEFLKGDTEIDESEIKALIDARIDAKKNKDFAKADQIRQELKANGIVLEDTAAGTSWRKE
jgi:cysteinyl-tRNA synthetase